MRTSLSITIDGSDATASIDGVPVSFEAAMRWLDLARESVLHARHSQRKKMKEKPLTPQTKAVLDLAEERADRRGYFDGAGLDHVRLNVLARRGHVRNIALGRWQLLVEHRTRSAP